MALSIRTLEYSDYDNILVGWWHDWNWIVPTRDFLPDDGKSGMIVYDDDIPICAGFVYMTNSKASWVDWIISNKNYRKKPQRKEAILLLLNSLTDVCNKVGSMYCYALIKHPGLIESYEQLGYIKGDSYSKEMIKIF